MATINQEVKGDAAKGSVATEDSGQKPTLSLNADLKISRAPWVAQERLSGSENHKGWRIFAHTGYPIGEIYPLNSDPSPAARANVALITAAPKLHAALEKINALACYASEENTDYREQALLEIGMVARTAIAMATSEQKGITTFR